MGEFLSARRLVGVGEGAVGEGVGAGGGAWNVIAQSEGGGEDGSRVATPGTGQGHARSVPTNHEPVQMRSVLTRLPVLGACTMTRLPALS